MNLNKYYTNNVNINRFKKIVIINFILIFICAILMEIFLQFASSEILMVEYVTSSPQRFERIYGPQMLPDDRLGLKGNPKYPDLDGRGFRNNDALTRATVAAMGDSHTFGTNVAAADAWPSVLAKDMALPVYNMGHGSYGPAHNNENLSIALGLKPKFVIFALYFGNDFIDDFLFARRNNILSSLVPVDVMRAVRARKPDNRLAEEAEYLFGNSGKTKNVGPIGKFARSLTDYSRLYGFLRTLKNYYFPERSDNITNLKRFNDDGESSGLGRNQDARISLFDDSAWKTIFTARYRSLVVDYNDPRIRAGVAISKRMIARMQERVRGAGAKFLVLLIPTKEFVFSPKVERPERHPHLVELVRNETKLRRELIDYLGRQGIAFLDMAPALRSAPSQPYFANADGHENPLGHSIIAGEVRKYLASNEAQLIAEVPAAGGAAATDGASPGPGKAGAR